MFTRINFRNRDFVKAVDRVMSSPEGRGLTVEDAVVRAIATPTSYYLDYQTAYRLCREMQGGKRRAMPNPLKRRMWQEFYGRVMLLTASDGLELAAAVSRVLFNSQASQFFITPKTALAIYHEMKRHS